MARDSSGTKNEPQYSATGVSSQAADLSEVAEYAAWTGNHKIGPTTGTATGPGGMNTGRTTSTGSDVWEGLVWEDTTDGFTYKYKSGAWVKQQSAPYAIEANLVNIVVNNGGGTIATITFTSGEFTQAPLVMVSIQTSPGVGRKLNAQATGVTTTGFQLVLSTGDGTTPSPNPTITVAWMAVQMFSGSAVGAA